MILHIFSFNLKEAVSVIKIVEKEELLTVDGLDSNCRDATGDEDSCCEYGIDKMPIFNTVTLFDMLK